MLRPFLPFRAKPLKNAGAAEGLYRRPAHGPQRGRDPGDDQGHAEVGQSLRGRPSTKRLRILGRDSRSRAESDRLPLRQAQRPAVMPPSTASSAPVT